MIDEARHRGLLSQEWFIGRSALREIAADGWRDKLCTEHLVKIVNIDLGLADRRLPLPDIVDKLVRSRDVLLILLTVMFAPGHDHLVLVEECRLEAPHPLRHLLPVGGHPGRHHGVIIVSLGGITTYL